jgi:hypothetical protein
MDIIKVPTEKDVKHVWKVNLHERTFILDLRFK